MAKLKGITWNHSRGFTSVVATAQRFCELHPDVEIEWEKRSLQEFADAPIQNLADQYDLLIIDHPWAGFAQQSGILADLSLHLPPEFLTDQKENSVGKSHLSYNFDGFQSALAVDAATPIAVYNQQFFSDKAVPKNWQEVLALAREDKVAIAGIPLNLLMDFYMFGATINDSMFQNGKVIDEESGVIALESIREIVSLCREDILKWDPIDVHNYMAKNKEIVYCPYAYGYTNYSKPGYGEQLLVATDTVMFNNAPLKTVLGGTGLAVSSASENLELACKYAEYTASPLIQETLFFDAGGQPGHRKAWLNPETNRRCENFFKNTLNTLDNSYLRPRYNGYLHFQDNAGHFVQDYAIHGGNPKDVLVKLNALYQESLNQARS
ncbi:extracellular solute-binding protein [Enterococcus hulanensis]|uniref:ABC transporter substrate-binding protein n=1 Tax=Enterococcus hulanensis TaxID=2559929 RepID=UPI001A908A61|nr:extracellular solute-binding protein [Enterococcus hulanensis]MBO0455165.1 extracellular solute-binding protein [Enterococcus hulanensis]